MFSAPSISDLPIFPRRRFHAKLSWILRSPLLLALLLRPTTFGIFHKVLIENPLSVKRRWSLILIDELVSCTTHRSIFEGLRIGPAFRLKRSERRNAGSETQQQDPVKYYRTSGPIWTGWTHDREHQWSPVPGASRGDMCPDHLLRWRPSGKFVPLSTCTGVDQHRGGPFEILKS